MISSEELVGRKIKIGELRNLCDYPGNYMRALCDRVDVEEFGKKRELNVSDQFIRMDVVCTGGGIIKNNFPICLKCGRMDHFIGKKNKNRLLKLNYRAINYRDRVLRYDGLYRLELEHWRLRNEKLLVNLWMYRLVDDRLLEKLFDKLLSVLPFEIAYLIMY